MVTWATWNLDPSVLAGIALVTLAYVVAVIVPRRASPARMTSFMVGMLVLFLALESPLDPLGDRYLLSMHMLQHLLLVYAVPPLLVFGTPGWVVRPLAYVPVLGGLARWLTRGPIAFAIYNVVFGLAHLPNFFDLTLHNEGIHILEHLLFIATGVLAWWPILSTVPELPRLSYPYQMLYLFLGTLPCSLVGALITLPGVVLYAPYAAAPRIWNLAPLADQQIAGLSMWIGGSLYYFLAFMVVFFLWAGQEEPERPRLHIVKGTSG